MSYLPPFDVLPPQIRPNFAVPLPVYNIPPPSIVSVPPTFSVPPPTYPKLLTIPPPVLSHPQTVPDFSKPPPIHNTQYTHKPNTYPPKPRSNSPSSSNQYTSHHRTSEKYYKRNESTAAFRTPHDRNDRHRSHRSSNEIRKSPSKADRSCNEIRYKDRDRDYSRDRKDSSLSRYSDADNKKGKRPTPPKPKERSSSLSSHSSRTSRSHHRGEHRRLPEIDRDSRDHRSQSLYNVKDFVRIPQEPNSINDFVKIPHKSRDKSVSDSRKSKHREERNRNKPKNRAFNYVEKNDDKEAKSDRDKILEQYRKEYCSTSEEILEKLEKLAKENNFEEEEKTWFRSSPADLYYKNLGSGGLVEAKPKDIKLCETFFKSLIERGRQARPEVDELPPLKMKKPKLCHHKPDKESSSEESIIDPDDDEIIKDEADRMMQELERKQTHPRRLHPEMWFNDAGQMNGGPLCRCSPKARRQGVRHNVYAGEEMPPKCEYRQNNCDKLFHYRITVSPPTNFLIKTPTIIAHDEHEFLFSGFSMFSHYKLQKLPTCKVIRFNIEYTILYEEEMGPLNFTIQELDLFEEYLFTELLELVDLNLGKATETGCSQFHFMPRFARNLSEGGCEVLSMCEVLKYLLKESHLLVPKRLLADFQRMDHFTWQKFVDRLKGMIVTYPGKKPCSVRVDQLDRSPPEMDPRADKSTDKHSKGHKGSFYPEIVHFGFRPPQLSYAGNPSYQKAWRYYVKYRHLIANMAKPSVEERCRLQAKEATLQEMRTQSKMKRDVTVAISSEGFYSTGLMCDLVQHAMLIPVLVRHLRIHHSLDRLEDGIGYKFKNRALLQKALTHPSYRENFGTNPDHARNSLTNCGIRQPEYGDRRIHYMNTRKRGINTLIDIMSRFGKKSETESAISHNERLEFLGDAVIEFLSSIHLFKMFPGLAEGGLATYRAAIVQNQHLSQLAKKIGLENYLLYAHGSDLCRDLELRHAMANCFEALMGALFLDGDINVADKVFSLALWYKETELLDVWNKERVHPLQEQEPLGDRKYIKDFEFLQSLSKFEESIGIQFKHIRLLARAFTDRSVGFTHLTLGSNQRLEFLGDTVLQLVVSDRLYRFFPEHHEGHLSLLRSSLVNNRTQSIISDDLNMSAYAIYHNLKVNPSTKDKADLLEAFLGALYIDKNIEYCTAFCNACLFPRLQEFILNQDWNDPKSKLQQCCLTLRSMEGGEPDIPMYKVIECLGPTNTRVYTVAVYFRGVRLASAQGHSIQEAEMNAAKEALSSSHDLFPQLDHQKRVIAKTMKRQKAKRNKDKNSKAGSSAAQSKLSEERKLKRNLKRKHPITDDRIPNAYKPDSQLLSEESSSAEQTDDERFNDYDAIVNRSDFTDSGHDSDTSTKVSRPSSRTSTRRQSEVKNVEETNNVDNEETNNVDNEETNNVDNEETNNVDNEETNNVDNEETNNVDNEEPEQTSDLVANH